MPPFARKLDILKAETMAKESSRYSEQETQRRFEKAVKAALNTPPKLRKSITWKRRNQLRTKSKNQKSRVISALSGE
jgi:hypothetical protein